MKPVVSHAYGGRGDIDPDHTLQGTRSLLPEHGEHSRWVMARIRRSGCAVQPATGVVVALLFISLMLAYGPPAEATTVQIQAGAAQNASRSIVRTASGNLYAVVLDTSGSAVRVYESTNGGSSWTQQDAAHAPASGFYQMPSAAIDGNGIIHIAYWNATVGLRYVTFSTVTNTFSGDTAVVSFTATPGPIPVMTAIAVDSNNATHIAYADWVKASGNNYNTVTYIDNVGGRWNSKVQVYGASSKKNGCVGDILINQNNVPEISYGQCSGSGGSMTIAAAVGNANKATSFTSQVVASSIYGTQQPSIALDSANNTWVAYLAGPSTTWVPAVVKHNASDSWSTWQTPVQDSSASVEQLNATTVALATIGTTLYVAYPSSTFVVWQSYNGSSWSAATSLGQFSNTPVLKWSEWFNNGSCDEIDVLITEPFNVAQPNGPVGAYWSNITSSFPTISNLSPSSGFVGASISINGSSLQAVGCTSTVAFNGVAATPTSVSNAQIIVPVPSGATTGPVVANVGSVASNALPFIVLGAISGTVTSASNGSAISGALVQVLQFSTVKAMTNTAANGSYTILNLLPGNYDILASASGFGTGILTGSLIVSGNTTIANASLQLPGTLSGQITKADGVTPIPGATVAAAEGEDAAGSATTDSNGNYTIPTLAAGSYTALAAAAGFVTQTSGGVSVTAGNTTTKNFSLSAAGTQSVISYFYDELGRLIGASDSQSNTATYAYDAVGNLLSISVNPSSQVSIAGFDPVSGPVGTSVTISGTGFSATASQDTVTFNGTTAAITSASTTQLAATVPTGATTGPIKVTTPSGSATSSSPFTVTTH